MKCKKAKEFLSVYIDDELDAGLEIDKERRLKGHLEGCLSCRSYLHDLQNLSMMLRSAREDIPRVDLWPKLRDRLPVRKRWFWWADVRLKWNRKLSWASLGGAVALALSILMVSFFTIQGDRGDVYLQAWASGVVEGEIVAIGEDNPAKILFMEAWQSRGE